MAIHALEKNAPLILLFIGGALSTQNGWSYINLAVSLMVIFAASAFMTQLNIITDRELDQESKHHLYEYISYKENATRLLMAIELGICFSGIGWLSGQGLSITANCLLVFLGVTVLYSYNFFPSIHPLKRD